MVGALFECNEEAQLQHVIAEYMPIQERYYHTECDWYVFSLPFLGNFQSAVMFCLQFGFSQRHNSVVFPG